MLSEVSARSLIKGHGAVVNGEGSVEPDTLYVLTVEVLAINKHCIGVIRYTGIGMHAAAIAGTAGIASGRNLIRIAISGRRPHVSQNAQLLRTQGRHVFAHLPAYPIGVRLTVG